jgi:hypothetical protein
MSGISSGIRIQQVIDTKPGAEAWVLRYSLMLTAIRFIAAVPGRAALFRGFEVADYRAILRRGSPFVECRLNSSLIAIPL